MNKEEFNKMMRIARENGSLTTEEIEDIIKIESKYEDVNFINDTNGGCFSFAKKDTSSKEIRHIYYRVSYLFYELKTPVKEFIIKNNAIELKHLLDIEITEEDITNWLLSIGFEKEDNYYFKSNKDYWLVYKDKKIYQNYTDIECYSLPTFEVENSNDYWRLYNIIINLIGLPVIY